MAEYIEREALFKKALEEKRFVFQMEDLLNNELVVKTVYKDFAEFVNSIPAADVAPVVRGRWITGVIEREPVIKNGRVYRNDTPTFQCSKCKETFAGITYGFNYCPNCGARMDGE